MVQSLEEDVIAVLLRTLNRSRQLSERSVKNEDLAHAFQEAMLSEWGLGDEDVEEALMNVATLSQTQGSAMFFLTQSAGATNVVMRILRSLYQAGGKSHNGVDWDREKFAAPHLLETMKDVLYKFVESEAKEGHLIDPNVWRNASASGGKVAVYCTSFAAVVVGILKAMLSFEADQLERNKHAFFPMICRLIRVQSDEIRHLVHDIMMEKFAPMLGVDAKHDSWNTADN